MKPTATQILQRCKDIVGGKHAQPEFFDVFRIRDEGYAFYVKGTYILVHSLYISTLYSSYDFPAFLLGMDSEPAPVVLEWVEDELKYESVAHHAYYNGLIECYISASKDEKARFAWISVNRSRVANMPEKYQHVKTAHEARAWCVEQITKIITPTPKP